MSLEQKLLDYYSQNLSSENNNSLKLIESISALHSPNPAMMSEFSQGRLLSLISRLLNPKFILEIGTYMAYSTLCLAEGLQKKGKIHSIEKNEDYEQLIKQNINSCNLKDKIEVIFGVALEVLKTLDISIYELIYMDASKKEYSFYYDIILEQAKSGTILIIDNVLWKGKVLDNNKNKIAKSMDEFNNKIFHDKRVQNFILPFRDGINIITVN